MSTVQLCLGALHTDIEKNGSHLDIQAAQQYIFQINQYFKSDITSIESEVALKTLFVDNCGILSYAEAIINLDLINLKTIIADILFLFLQLIESFPSRIGYYIKSITSLCDLCSITPKKFAILSIKTYQIYKKLLELNNFNDQLDINKIIEHLNYEVSLGDKISSTVRQHIYNLLGFIGQHHPMYLKNYADKLLNLFCYELQNQIDTQEKNLKKFSAPIAIGCLNGLTGLLNNFADHIETHDYGLHLYAILKKLIGTVEENKRHVINRTGLKLFQKHIQLFLKFLFQDSSEVLWFQKKLWDWCTLPNLEDKKIGLSSFEVLYKGASMEFTKKLKINEINSRNTLQKIVEIMILFLKSKMGGNYSDFQEHAVVVRSIGWLSEPCYILLGEDNLIETFIILSLQAEEKFLNHSLEIKNYDPNAAHYLNSLSLIIRNLKILNSDQISFMQRLSINCFNDFITAQPKSEWQDNIINALIISMYCLASSHGNILDKYLKQLFYVGLVKSCSHRIAFDAEIVEEYTGHVIFKSTSYVPLWICLLKANQCHSFDLYLNIPITVKSILEKSLMCSFMSSVLKIITKLDLFTNKSLNECEFETEFIARKPSDFTVLINLVQVYSEILYSLELDIETTTLWLPHVLDTIINHSMKFPIASSLYKILTVIFQELDWCILLENNKNNSIKEKILIYLNYTMLRVHIFRGDLQFCCLEMLMSLPSIIIQEIYNNQMIEIIKTALILGSTFLSLAKITVNALERWQQDLSKNEMDQLLTYIMPYLDLLLRTKGYDSEVELDNSILYQMQIQNYKKKTLIKQNKLFIKPESELEIVQTKILKYLAHLDMTSCLRLLGDPNTTTSNPINIINYKLSFNDCKINISFDHLLPRILELCQYCSNRQIRFIACETFHAYVILYLGNNLILERSKPTEMKIVTAKIIPVVIKLACDMDNLVQQLFEPLAIGIVHYFASGIQYNSIYTPIIIDILMDCVSDSNEAVKKFSAKCILEFIHWTLKINNKHLKPSISLRIIINKIQQFCIHPNPDKQLGAAITFNSCYSILREDEIVINELWIQLLYYFVLILDSNKSSHSEEHILKAIDHLQRVFMEKSNLFNEICDLRIVPKQFYGNQLYHVVEWLLKYIGSPIANCRSRCLNLANSLSNNVKDHNSLKNVLESFITSHGEDQLIKCIERDLNSFINLKNINCTSYNECLNFESTFKILINWLNQLIAALDCYVSLFKENMINFKILKSPCSSLFQSIHYFLFQIEEFSFIQWLNNMNLPFTKNDKEIIIQSRNYNILKNHVIVGIFQFLNGFDNNLLLMNDINQDKINELALKYIFEYNTDYSDKKSNLHQIEVVHYIKNKCCSSIFSNELRQQLQEKWSNVVSNMNNVSMHPIQNNFINVNQLLLSNNIISSMDLLCIVDRKCILEVIFKYVYNNGVSVYFETLLLSYLEHLLDFVINLDYQNDVLMLLIIDTIEIFNINTNKNMAFGQYFFNLFSKPITKYFLKIPDLFVNKLFTEYTLNDMTLNVILEVLKTSSDEKINGQGQLIIAKIVNNIKYWEQFQLHFSWNEIYEFVELSSNIVNTFRNENMIFFQKWICDNLVNDSLIIYYKCKLLAFLPKLVSSEMYKEPIDDNIRKCLIDFRDKYFSGTSTDLRPHNTDFTHCATAFQKILTAMEISSSYLLFEVVVEWCIKDPNYVCIKQVDNTLFYFFKRLSDDTQFLCCQYVYGKFRNENMSESRRQMIMNTFLIPIVSYCRKTVIIKLYTDIIDFILTTVNENLLANDSGKARQLLVSKIACFKLVEEMFKFFTYTELNNSIIPCKLIGSQPKNLIIQFRNSAVRLRYSNVNYRNGSKEIQQLLRQLHCFSYNALVTIIINTENDYNKYTIFLFNEHPPKQFIWRHLVDCSIHHEFPIDFETIPQRKKKLINIRTKFNQNLPNVYIDLNSHLKNTLVEDLENYDYNNSYLRSNIEDCSLPNSQSLNQMFSVELEMDSFNNHECMAHLCAAIKSLTTEENTIGSSIKPIVDMPDWMKSLKLSFCDKSSDILNSKILLIKLIINCETNFQPYAKHWLGPIMQFILDKHLGNNLNYFIADVVSMLVSWHNIAVPSTDDEKFLAKNLLCFLLTVSHSEMKNVFKHNMELIKLIVENWKCSLEMDFDILLSLLKQNQINKSLECGLHLIGIITANGILPFNEINTKIFVSSLMENIKSNNQVISILGSEIFGMLLKIFYDNAMDEIELLQSLSSILTFSENIDITKVLNCLYYVHKHYSKILDSFVDDLFNVFEKLHGIHRTQCLEMILNVLSKIDNPYEKIIKLKNFFNMLKNNGTDDQLLCFKIVLQLIPSLHAEGVVVLIKIITDNSYLHSNNHRKLVYDIMCCTYEIYLRNGTEISKQILEMCKKVLLNGLTDSDDELRQQLFRFWADDKRLPLKCIDRLLILLDQLYSPDIESHFLGNLVSILLESCCTVVDFDQKIFQYPLHACEFEDYKLTVSWRAKKLATVPEYADTIASQLYRSNTFGYNESDVHKMFQIKKTLSFQFEPTLVQTQLTNSISALESYSPISINIANTSNNINEQNWNKNLDTSFMSKSDFIQQKKIRLLRDKSKLGKQFAVKNMQMNFKREIFKKERSQKRESSVITYRKYRIGDFPDIEISNASVIKPMIELAKRDNNIARIILSSIMYGFKNSPKIDQQYFESLNKSLTNMINHCHSSNPSLVGFILDTAYCYPTQINLDPNKITEVATSCGLMSLGALILETSINNSLSKEIDVHIAKKSKITYKCSDDVWMKLAEVYKNMGELDVVESIIQDKMNNLSSNLLKEALKAEQSDDWRTAQIKFKSVLECNDSDIFLENDKNFLFEEYYKCSEHLSDWKEINKMLKSQIGENYEKIWDNNWHKEHLLSRILHSELHEILVGESDGKFIETFSNWLNDRCKEEYILKHVAAQACMIFLCCDDTSKAQLWCKLRMHNFLKEWENISPQYYKLRADRLLNLQTISEIYDFTSSHSIQANDNINVIKRQIQTWQSNMPTDFDSLLAWDIKILYRSFLFNKIKATIDELPSETKYNLKQFSNKYEVELMLALIESAINKNNFHIAKKYINEYRFENIENWKSDFILCRSKILALSSNYTINVEKKLQYYLNSWSELDDIIKEQCSSNCLLKIHIHIANISKNIIKILHDVSDISLLSNNLKLEIMNKIKSNLQFGNLHEVVQQIDGTIIKNFKSAIHIALNSSLSTKTIVNTYLILAQYCLEDLNHKENNEDNNKKELFIESVLKAMNYNEKKASELFPIILQFENLHNSRLKETFLIESQHVPEHMFLPWINQILGCLDSPLISVISPLLIRVSKIYPKAVQLPLRIYMEKDVYNNEECELFLKTKLLPLISDIHLDLFVKAITNVCCPFTQLSKFINDVQKCMKTNCFSKVVLAFENIFNNCFITEENQKFKGKEFKILEIFKDKLKVILDNFQSYSTDMNDSYEALEIVKKQLFSYKIENYCKKQTTNLIHYCPWLAQYSHHSIDTLEVPGQYSGIKKPNPDNHIIITYFKPDVQVMHSKRSPIKITMVGNDGKNYNFLVKFGEDLRQDQRVEQLLQVMNNTLFENKYCCERQLSLITYTVHPISKILGLIEWLNSTVTLKDFVCESFSNGKEIGIKQLQSKVVEHNTWLSEKSVSSNMLDIYKHATIEYNPIVTTAKFKQLVQSIPENILRKSLLNMCYCAEMYVHLRSKFITSYSVLSICHWLLGIGDRHLNNTIVSNKTGCCIGIDFDFAFHTATSVQFIPELIPFRMSPHIVSLMAPLNLTGFIRETMVHTLKTLINNKEMLLSVMQVFINDPSANWIEIASTKALKTDADFDHKEILWFPKKKIHSCKDKLIGTNPIDILSRELESSSIPNDYKNALINMLKSDSQSNIYKRSKLPINSITPHQQVDCLLDIATDEHILGKAYSGLELWV